jgi:hypothetical protein
MAHYPSRLRFKLPAERIAELVEKNCTILTDEEMVQFMAQIKVISDCNETPDLVTP